MWNVRCLYIGGHLEIVQMMVQLGENKDEKKKKKERNNS